MSILIGILGEEIEKYAEKYQIKIIVLPDQNHCIYLSKDFIDLQDFPGESLTSCMIDCLNYLYRINRVPVKDRRTVSQNPYF